ncbi:MAG: endonuclease [Planctomycetota bacterium]|nr:MAG: endonuclease [Planctomycetota bacterium]
MRPVAHEAYELLLASLGPQAWWPGDTPFEVMVGAVLVQNTAWRNVERALENLKQAEALDPHVIHGLAPTELEELIRPAGYFRIKARRLRNLIDYLVARYDGSLEAMRQRDASQLREELLAVHGIGPETADSILLYALHKPVLVVDAYTHRIWSRHGWIDDEADYHRLQEEIASGLPDDAQTLNEFHALIVNVGHHWCKRVPKCHECPLRPLLPEGGPCEHL